MFLSVSTSIHSSSSFVYPTGSTKDADTKSSKIGLVGTIRVCLKLAMLTNCHYIGHRRDSLR